MVDEFNWAQEREVEREALSAGQQLARENSSALRDVRQAMQGRSDRHDAQLQLEEELQHGAGRSRSDEEDGVTFGAGQHLAQDSQHTLQDSIPAAQGKSAYSMSRVLCL